MKTLLILIWVMNCVRSLSQDELPSLLIARSARKPSLAIPVSVSRSLPVELVVVSKPYAAQIRSGKATPHPRHWLKLADLAEIQ
jgi:hypothetical protein